MDNERKIVDLNKPHLLGKHYPAACSVPTLTEQAALFFPEIFERVSESLYKDPAPLYDQPMVLKLRIKDNRTLP
jgi:hypothetical protein